MQSNSVFVLLPGVYNTGINMEKICQGIWNNQIHRILHKHGFLPSRNMQWRMPPEGNMVSLYSTENLNLVCHVMRESWRKRCFETFLAQSRRDSTFLRDAHVQYNSDRALLARKTYQHANEHIRAVMHGTALSPCVYAVIGGVQVPEVCPDCKQQLEPTWHHVLWECPFRHPPRAPADALEARLGWPIANQDLSLLAYMASVRVEMMNRFGFRRSQASMN